MREQLFQEILMARQRVYAVAPPTPLDEISLPFEGRVFIKREDLSPIHAYKWRGAYNRMALLTEEERARGVVCASAGNHAQGVALAAAKLGIQARVYMPVSTPHMKRNEVLRHGGRHVEIILIGDSYSDAAQAALEYAEAEKLPFVHPYDDLATMGGQGTIGDEIVMSGQGPFDVAYLQIGGGGMAAAVACWLRAYYPDIRIVGVEGVQQASMAAAVKAGKPVALDYVDVFCDGTAVKKAGTLTHALCAELIDEFITVTNEEVSAAIEVLWNKCRCIPEPSGAMGLAGLLKQQDQLAGKKAVTILCGANVDFEQLGWIAQHAGIGAARRRYYRFEMPEIAGGLLHLLDNILETVNIIEVQYGKIDDQTAVPVIGFEATPATLQELDERLTTQKIPHLDVTSKADVEFRIINYEPHLFRHPYFIILEFPERAGALREFLQAAQTRNSICYFNYTYSGEQVGRALIGFEFETEAFHLEFREHLAQSGSVFHEVEQSALERML